MKRLIALFLVIALTSLSAKTLTNTEGRRIEVEILQIGDNSVDVRRSDGFKFNIPFSKLSAESRESLKAPQASKLQSEAYDFNALNDLLGLQLWNDADLWNDPADQVAKRIGWPLESKTASQSSYRTYLSRKHTIAERRAYTAVLYAQRGKVDYISIMFSNKGDSVKVGEVTDQQDALRAVNAAIDADTEALRARLDRLGESKNETGGVTRGMKEKALRWDYGNNSFWLATVKDEYISLRIMPPELADRWGQPEYLSDESVRSAAKANVQENEFGDVLIKNIPMVNQGPKGYCVPATMERYLRYMGIRADMYTLAMAGSTTIGGGTILSEIIEGTSSYVRRSSRKMETISSEVSIKDVKKYIDRGQPLMWTMYSTETYNSLANTITKQRKQAINYKEWRKALRTIIEDAPKLYKDRNKGHVCLIVGYNKETDEVAVSDSWGPKYELRWISAEVAQTISQGTFYIIDF